ncbi:MAG: hypothetical protein K6E77_04880 [Lachnospiraceae bacterium]|nr:hypothetical protein [Lachnospiraceae bacterium]
MKRRIVMLMTAAVLSGAMLTACGGKDVPAEVTETETPAEETVETEETTADPETGVTEDAAYAAVKGTLDTMTGYYTGVSTAGETIYWSENGNEAIIVYYDAAGGKTASFAGPETIGEVSEAGEVPVSVTDNETGNTINFLLTYDAENDLFQFDMGDELGTAILTACTEDEMYNDIVGIINSGAEEVNTEEATTEETTTEE